MDDFLYFISIIFASLIVGFLIKLISQRKLSYINEKIKLGLSSNTIASFSNICFFWILLLGIHISATTLPPKFHNLTNIVNKTLIILFILSLTWITYKFIINFIKSYFQEKAEFLSRVSIFEIIVKILIFFIGFILVLHTLNINITPFITSLGVAGLVIGLALKDTLSNFFAGLHILITKQIKPGDYISLEGGVEGYVEDITWRNTVIKQLQNNLVIIPNEKIVNSVVTNYFLPDKSLTVPVQVGVSYGSDLEKVEKITIEVAKEVMREVPGGVPEFEPRIRYHTFGDLSINFTVVLKAQSYVDKFLIIHEFIKRLNKRYQQEGIQFRKL